MDVSISFAVSPAEFDPAEFSSTAEVWHNPSGKIVGVKEYGTLEAGTFTDGDGNEHQLLELVHNTAFVQLHVPGRGGRLR